MLNEYQSQGHSLTLVKGHSDFKVKTCFYAPNFEEVEGAYWFGPVCLSVCP